MLQIRLLLNVTGIYIINKKEAIHKVIRGNEKAESMKDIWKETKVSEGELSKVRIGPLGIWIKRIHDEWDVAVKRIDESDDEADSYYESRLAETVVDALEWQRWAAGDDEGVFKIEPVMPDRPVVVRPETSFSILPSRSALMYVSVPVFVRILIGKSRSFLCEQPTVVLSNTWFGEPTSGELCYSLFTRARRNVLKEQARPHRAVCPVRIENVSSEQLAFTRLCLRVGHLSIFRGENQLWTNEVKVIFESSDGASRINYVEGAPKIDEAGEMLGNPRIPLTKGIIESGLRNLRIFG